MFLKIQDLFTAMVRVRMSARLYPPRGSIMQTMGIWVRYSAPWVHMDSEFRGKWKVVNQQIEQARVNRVIKAKKDKAVCILWGVLLGSRTWLMRVDEGHISKRGQTSACSWRQSTQRAKSSAETMCGSPNQEDIASS